MPLKRIVEPALALQSERGLFSITLAFDTEIKGGSFEEVVRNTCVHSSQVYIEFRTLHVTI